MIKFLKEALIPKSPIDLILDLIIVEIIWYFLTVLSWKQSLLLFGLYTLSRTQIRIRCYDENNSRNSRPTNIG